MIPHLSLEPDLYAQILCPAKIYVMLLDFLEHRRAVVLLCFLDTPAPMLRFSRT